MPAADPSMMGGMQQPGQMPMQDPSMMGGMPQPGQMMGGEEEDETPKQSIRKKTGEISQLATQAKNDQVDPFTSPDAKWALNMLASALGDTLDMNDKKDVVKTLNKAGNVDPNMGMGGGEMSQGMGGGMPQMPAPQPMQQPMQQPMMAHRNPRPVMESYDDVINEIVGELLGDKERHTKRPERKITNKKVKRTNPFVSDF